MKNERNIHNSQSQFLKPKQSLRISFFPPDLLKGTSTIYDQKILLLIDLQQRYSR